MPTTDLLPDAYADPGPLAPAPASSLGGSTIGAAPDDLGGLSAPTLSPFGGAPYFPGRVRFDAEPQPWTALPAFDLAAPSPSLAPLGSWPAAAPPVALLSPRSGGLMDSFTLPAWSDLFGDTNSLGSTGLAFLQEQNRADAERARLNAQTELLRLRALPAVYDQGAPSLLSIPSLTAGIPRWVLVALVAFVALKLLGILK